MFIFVRRYCTQYDQNLISSKRSDVFFAIYSLYVNKAKFSVISVNNELFWGDFGVSYGVYISQ